MRGVRCLGASLRTPMHNKNRSHPTPSSRQRPLPTRTISLKRTWYHKHSMAHLEPRAGHRRLTSGCAVFIGCARERRFILQKFASTLNPVPPPGGGAKLLIICSSKSVFGGVAVCLIGAAQACRYEALVGRPFMNKVCDQGATSSSLVCSSGGEEGQFKKRSSRGER
jgi:hypothetical protein